MKYDCKCGQSFDSMKLLQAHWNDPDRGPGPHFRTGITSSNKPVFHSGTPTWGHSAMSRQGSANPHECICGYPATSAQDLDEHIVAASDEQDHAPVN